MGAPDRLQRGPRTPSVSVVPVLHTMQHTRETAARLMGQGYDRLDARAQKVARHLAERKPIARDPTADSEAHPTRGQRAADAVASFGGSWLFVGLFGATLALWIAVNTALLVWRGQTFDPYPFILLNLVLSMLAAIQAPVILMSQNRQGQKDRLHAEHDYEVNLKAELEIMMLHQKLDALRQTQWAELLDLQQQQLALLAGLVQGNSRPR
jgi:uncharacterized membrane protein